MPRTVILVEKGAVAKEVASFLAKQQGGRAKREDCGYRLPNGDFVGYTNGHLVEMAPIDHYLTPEHDWVDPLEYLPVLPPVHMRMPRPRRNEDGSMMMRDGAAVPDSLFVAIERELRIADIIINAGDEDIEVKPGGEVMFSRYYDVQFDNNLNKGILKKKGILIRKG